MKNVLDVCCGSRMFYFDKLDNRVAFNDIRSESHTLCDGRTLEICPDTQFDFTDMSWFESDRFHLVVFDPPHLVSLGKSSWMAKKYGVLKKEWREDLKKGFSECFRVLKPNGTLIFKWNETQIPVGEILKCTDQKPLFGHKSGRQSKTHWICFMKAAPQLIHTDL